jgi:hypothetical protein
MTIAAERIKPCGAVAAGMRILGSERGTNGVRLAALIPASYTAASPGTCRNEVRHLSALADLAAEGRVGAVTLSDNSRIVTRHL